jgi:hypothetical protein
VARRKNRVYCPICNRTFSRSIIHQHFDRHVQELLANGVIRVLRFKDGTECYGYKGKWYISVRELLEEVAREEGK